VQYNNENSSIYDKKDISYQIKSMNLVVCFQKKKKKFYYIEIEEKNKKVNHNDDKCKYRIGLKPIESA